MAPGEFESGRRLSCLIAIATYNEIENLPDLIDQVLSAAPHFKVLVVDDNSPDGTGRWCQERAATDDRVDCLLRPGKLGLGSAAVECMHHSIEHGYDLLLTMDADFSHHPRYLLDLMRPLEQSDEVDVVIGSRYVPGGGVKNWPLHRRLMSRAINFYTRKLLGVSPRDCSGAFRCYRVDALKKIKLEEIQSKGFSYPEEVLWRLEKAGAKVQEVPIVFTDRESGLTKINLAESIGALRLLARLAAQNRKGR